MNKTNSTLAAIVNILNEGKEHDGTTIGSKLKITRSTICKAIKKLQNYGVKVISTKGKGYELPEPLIMLDEKKISYKAIKIDILESIGSTNDYLKSFYNSNTKRVCIAEHQTKGKGRLGRTWHSPFAENLYLSCLYFFQKDVSEMAGLSLLVGLALIRTLNNYHAGFKLKWPNDVVYNGKKIVGILIELQAEANGLCQAIIGAGINANMLKAKSITQDWTSLREITGNYIDRNKLANLLITNLLDCIHQFEKQGFAEFIKEWNSLDILYGNQISIKHGEQVFKGKGMGINPQGNLLLKLADGTIKEFSAGDTSVVKK